MVEMYKWFVLRKVIITLTKKDIIDDTSAKYLYNFTNRIIS